MNKPVARIPVAFVTATITALVILFCAPIATGAQASEQLRGQILEAIQAECTNSDLEQAHTVCVKYAVTVESDSQPSQTLIIEESEPRLVYREGEHVFLQVYTSPEGNSYAITGPVRESPIVVLVIIFIIATLLVGKLQGLGSLIGLSISIAVLFLVTIPAIINGSNPILAGFVGGVLVLCSSIYLSHGFNRKSTIALISTLLGLGMVSVLAVIFMELVRLTGFGSEESYFLINQLPNMIDMRGVLFASIIVGGIGVMDDVTVNQVSSMLEIHKANMSLDQKQLFIRSMNIGRDHIASMVNTLFIAYAGAAMPLIMLLQANHVPLGEIINNEIFAEEIVRTFIGSIGLILIVPITSLTASYIISRKKS